MKRPGLVIFDCDGVLVDTERLDNLAVGAYLSEFGVTVSEEEAGRLFTGLDNEGVKRVTEKTFGVNLPPEFVAETEARIQRALETGDFHAMAGARHAVDRLIAVGCPICVASNGEMAKMELTLGRTEFLETFRGKMFSKDQVARGKPAPDLFLYAAEQMGFAPAECVVIEDSPAGVRGAMEAGMRVLGFAPKGDPDGLSDLGAEVFPSMAEVPSLLGF